MFTVHATRSASAALLVLLISGVGGSVAQPIHSLAAQQGAGDRPSLDGVWRVSLVANSGMALEFRMTFALTNTSPVRWEAYSRAGAVRELVSGGTGLFGQLTGTMPPKQALVYFGDGTLEARGTSWGLEAAVESPFLGRQVLFGVMTGDRIRGDLKRPGSANATTTLEAVRETSSAPLRDYPLLAREWQASLRANIFDHALTDRREFQRFFSDINTRFGQARDDLDAMGAFQALKESLGVSHIDLSRNPQLASLPLEHILAAGSAGDPAGFVQLTFSASEVAHLRITRWDRGTPHIERAFERIVAAKARVLILDIRDNPGGDASSFAPLAHLMREPVRIGTFLGRGWYDKHRSAPSAEDLARLPTVTTSATPMEILEHVREAGAVTGLVEPRAPYFDGEVFVIVNRNAGSASEPITHILKTTRRATIVGERTAGRMLIALPFALRDGWVATVPVGDFITADGTRLEGLGVEPDLKTEPGEVFMAIAEKISRTLPYSAAALRGGSNESLKRTAEAERYYRLALQVADRQSPPPSAASLAMIHKRLARLLTAKGDRDGALKQYRELLKLVPNDAEALAAVRGKSG